MRGNCLLNHAISRLRRTHTGSSALLQESPVRKTTCISLKLRSLLQANTNSDKNEGSELLLIIAGDCLQHASELLGHSLFTEVPGTFVVDG